MKKCCAMKFFRSIAARKIDVSTAAELFIREDDDEIEFLTLLRFDSMDAVKEFAGADEGKPGDLSKSRSVAHADGRTLTPLPHCELRWNALSSTRWQPNGFVA
jgi:hypothetical protein